MNALKFQQDMLAEKLKDIADRNTAWGEMDDKHLLICLRTHVILCIPKEGCILDTSKLYHVAGLKDIAWDAIKMKDEENRLSATDRILIRPKGKMPVFTVGDREVGIDPNYLKYFDLKNARLYQAKEHGPILVVENFSADEFAGIIMPVRLNQTEPQNN